jgi:hypothetical protein
MLIKYRSGVVRSSRNARYISRIGILVSRSTVHMRSFFTFKRPVSKWRPTICVKSIQAMNIIVENDVITLTDHNPVVQNFALGMIVFFFNINLFII